MTKETKKPQKTEVLSMRMDQKTRFVLEVLARHRGQSISTVVERAIVEAAENINIGNSSRNWKDYWHVSEGVRWLLLASDQSLFPNFEDEYRLAFTKTHWPFFYVSSKCSLHKEWSIEILWPRIDEFVEIWSKTKSTDYWAAGKAMKKALADAGVASPEWPTKPEVKVETKANFDRNEMDDEIPF